MKKKYLIIAVVIILVAILIIPIPSKLKDGGSIEYKSLTYKITKVHQLNNNSKNGYDDGIIIKIFGVQVFNNVLKAKYQILTKKIDNAIISMNIPESWKYEDMPQNEADDSVKYDIKLYKRDKNKFALFYFNKPIGLCGTGRTVREITLNNGEKADVGYQDAHWSDIAFHSQDILFINRSLDSDEFKELVEIAKTLTVEKTDEHSFFGKVIESHSTYLIVEPNEGEEERKSSDKFSIDLGKNNKTTYKVGNNVKITYEGVIKESYPAQIDTTKIEIKSADSFKLIFHSTPGNVKRQIIDKRKNKSYDYNVYIYNGKVDIEINNKTYSLEEALKENKITMDEIIAQASKDIKEPSVYRDGGSVEYHYDNYTIIKFHTLDGNRDVYIGNKDLKLTDIK